jgi:hypothetical protein
MRKIKRKRLEEKNIQIGGIYILKRTSLALEIRPGEDQFNNEWTPGFFDSVSYSEHYGTAPGTGPTWEQRMEAAKIRQLQVERANFRRNHGRSLGPDTTLLLVSRAVVPACSKVNRQRTVLFQFLVHEKPAWFSFTERGYVRAFMDTFQFVKASKRKNS